LRGLKKKATKKGQKNMAKLKISGNAIVLTSDLKLDTIKKMEKYNPDALIIFNETKNGDREEVFKIGSGAISGISVFGITFAETNKAGLAVATILLPETIPNDAKKQFVKDVFGNTIFLLQDLEAAVKTSCEELDAAYAELDKIIVEE